MQFVQVFDRVNIGWRVVQVGRESGTTGSFSISVSAYPQPTLQGQLNCTFCLYQSLEASPHQAPQTPSLGVPTSTVRAVGVTTYSHTCVLHM